MISFGNWVSVYIILIYTEQMKPSVSQTKQEPQMQENTFYHLFL